VTTNVNDKENRKGDSPRNLSEVELRRSEERLKAILSSLPDLIFRVDREGTFLDFHAHSPDQFAVPPDRFLGKRLSDIMPEEIARESLRLIAETLRAGEVSPVQEYRLSVGGRLSDFEARFARCGSDEVVAIIRDITAKKQAEETIRRNAERLRQVQKFEAIARMAGGLAHHLNNLMTVVTGYSELLLTRLPEADPRHGEIMKIRAAGERAAELTRQLLAFSRLQVLRPREVDVNLFISHLSTTLRNLAGRSVRFTFSPGDGVGTIQVDPDHLGRTLTHLVANACDAMPGGGELRVITTTVEQVEPMEGVEPARGRYALLTVQDSGCGMDAEARNRIFEPFYSLKSGHEGMGLPSLYGFVKQSGGYIFVDSRSGDGTTFRIYFPCLDRITDPGAGSESPLAGTPDAG
jgi:two-component system, cell cycle sensor histidine kinase and response regulator CckA